MLNLLLNLRPLLYRGKVGKLAISNVEVYRRAYLHQLYCHFNTECDVSSGEQDMEKNEVNEMKCL